MWNVRNVIVEAIRIIIRMQFLECGKPNYAGQNHARSRQDSLQGTCQHIMGIYHDAIITSHERPIACCYFLLLCVPSRVLTLSGIHRHIIFMALLYKVTMQD